MIKTVFSTVDDLNVNWLKMELLMTFGGFQDVPRQTRFRSSHGPLAPSRLLSMRCETQGSSQGQGLYLPRSISCHVLCAVDLSRVFARYRNEFENASGQALPHGISMWTNIEKHSFQCKRKSVLADLRRLCAILDWDRQTPLCSRPLGDRFG